MTLKNIIFYFILTLVIINGYGQTKKSIIRFETKHLKNKK